MQKPRSLPFQRFREKLNKAVSSLDVFYVHWHRLRTLAAMLKSCEELRGSVTVDAELIGDVGNLMEEELRKMRETLRGSEKEEDGIQQWKRLSRAQHSHHRSKKRRPSSS